MRNPTVNARGKNIKVTGICFYSTNTDVTETLSGIENTILVRSNRNVTVMVDTLERQRSLSLIP